MNGRCRCAESRLRDSNPQLPVCGRVFSACNAESHDAAFPGVPVSDLSRHIPRCTSRPRSKRVVSVTSGALVCRPAGASSRPRTSRSPSIAMDGPAHRSSGLPPIGQRSGARTTYWTVAVYRRGDSSPKRTDVSHPKSSSFRGLRDALDVSETRSCESLEVSAIRTPGAERPFWASRGGVTSNTLTSEHSRSATQEHYRLRPPAVVAVEIGIDHD